jgi:energy-coupling factor transport system substrate-specific component
MTYAVALALLPWSIVMRLTTQQLALMGMLIALNVAIGGIVHVVKLPVYLDAIGTIVAAVALGLLPAVIVGVLSFVLAAVLVNPVYLYFCGTQAVIALFVYLLAAHAAAFKSAARVVATGIALGIVAGVVSAPVIVFVFGGVAGSGRDLITAGLISTGHQIYKSVILSGVASEPVDKLLQCLAAFYVLKSLPKTLLMQFRNPVLDKNGLL